MHPLASLRQELDEVDNQILALFAQRYRIRDRVMDVKIAHNIPVVVPDRVTEILDSMADKAKALDIPPDFARALYELVLDYSHQYEETFRQRNKA